MSKVIDVLAYVLSRTYFYKINKFFYVLSLRGIGINNSSALLKNGDAVVLKKTIPLSKNVIIIDVGANVGNYSTEVKAHNTNASIYSFEPHPKTFERLLTSSKKNGFTAINKALGEMPGVLNIYDYAGNDGSEHASLIEGVFVDLYKKEVRATPVDVITLDTFMKDAKIECIDLLKIDTEGYEINVLKGGHETIRNDKVKAIHFEFNVMNIVTKTFMADFQKLLPQYTFYRVLQNGLLRIETHQALLTEIFGFQNILALNNKYY